MAATALNALIDFAIGLLPVAGDLADIWWKANMRNVALIERHLRP